MKICTDCNQELPVNSSAQRKLCDVCSKKRIANSKRQYEVLRKLRIQKAEHPKSYDDFVDKLSVNQIERLLDSISKKNRTSIVSDAESRKVIN